MTGKAIREALEPIAKIADFFADEHEWRDHDTIRIAPLENLDEAQHITVGDLRRARTAYDAGGFGVKAEHIEAFRTVLESVLSAETSGARSPAIDFEARRFIRDHGAAILASLSPDDASAADAEIGRDFLNAIEAARDEYPWLADWTPAERYGELIGDLLDIAFPGGSASSDIVRGVVRLKALEWSGPRTGPDEYKIVARLGAFEGRYEIDPPYSKGEKFRVTRSWEINPFAWALTLDEAKAAAQADFERRVLSCLSTHTAAGAGPVGEPVGFQLFLSQLSSWGSILYSKEQAERMLAQDTHVPAMRPVYASPQEPGEVERLTRERDEARRDYAESDQNAQGLASDLAGTQAELAETRERLAKAEEAHGRAFALANELSWNPKTRNVGDRVRAALTGDAQEAGR